VTAGPLTAMGSRADRRSKFRDAVHQNGGSTAITPELYARMAETREFWNIPSYGSLAYSDLASRKMGMPGSASFHSAKKSS
jgi:hypothetical protein